MEKTFRLYIGADNTTGQVSIENVTQVLKDFSIEGATFINTIGLWGGELEKSLVVETTQMFHNEKSLAAFAEKLCKKLCEKLGQDCVGYMVLPKINFIS